MNEQRVGNTKMNHFFMGKIKEIRRSLAKFVDSPYYSELELSGGAVTVSFSKYLP
jgi:hypothetical protein